MQVWLAACLAACGPKEQPVHLYILAGQSNMAGRGEVAAVDTTIHPRVFALTRDMKWERAREPLHFDKPTIVGVGPGFAFGRAMAEAEPTATIGLIPTAVGGSSIKAWEPGHKHKTLNARPYDDALSRVFRVMALCGGELRGIIWHQGESDREMSPDEYLRRLEDLVRRFRTDLHEPNLPFVAGELGYFYTSNEQGAARINEVLSKLPSRVSHSAVVSAKGLSSKPDSIHFDAASARELGVRYARAVRELSSEVSDSR